MNHWADYIVIGCLLTMMVTCTLVVVAAVVSIAIWEWRQ